eukprot:6604224-Lingulodinium_polyedra.AAC.1
MPPQVPPLVGSPPKSIQLRTLPPQKSAEKRHGQRFKGNGCPIVCCGMTADPWLVLYCTSPGRRGGPA